jgi:hypothetical protein
MRQYSFLEACKNQGGISSGCMVTAKHYLIRIGDFEFCLAFPTRRPQLGMTFVANTFHSSPD